MGGHLALLSSAVSFAGNLHLLLTPAIIQSLPGILLKVKPMMIMALGLAVPSPPSELVSSSQKNKNVTNEVRPSWMNCWRLGGIALDLAQVPHLTLAELHSASYKD